MCGLHFSCIVLGGNDVFSLYLVMIDESAIFNGKLDTRWSMKLYHIKNYVFKWEKIETFVAYYPLSFEPREIYFRDFLVYKRDTKA